MTFVIGLLVFAMVLVSIALIFLVLIQLPKKDAGAGVAFGGGATDALFGAGSGTVLTKVTRYAAITFFSLALLIGFLQSNTSEKSRGENIKKLIDEQAQQLPVTQPAPAPATAPAVAPAAAPATTPAESPEKK